MIDVIILLTTERHLETVCTSEESVGLITIFNTHFTKEILTGK